MSWDKRKLENAIFARADWLNTAVEGIEGTFIYDGADECLQLMVCVYNAFFEEENRTFLMETGETSSSFWSDFCAQQIYPSLPLVRAFGVPFFEVDLDMELFLAGQ